MAAVVPLMLAGVAAAGTVVSAVGQIRQGQAAEAVGGYNAQIAQQNAQVAEENAVEAERAARAREAQSRQESRRVLARQRALAGVSGVATEGSPLLVMLESSRQAELDALRERYAGAIEARRARQQGALARAGGQLSQYEAQQYGRAARIGAGTTLLTGLTSLGAGLYRTYRPTGAGGSLLQD
jgi:hypothetical protein